MNDHYIESGIGWGGSGIRRAGNRVVAAALVAVVVVAGCGMNLPPAPPTTPPAASAAQGPTATVDPRAWAFAGVLQPDVVTQAPSLQPGYHCSPCHPAAASQLFGIAATSDGFLAVGVQQPPAEAILLASADGRSFEPVAGWDPGERTTAIAVASDPARTVVVGSGPAGADAWVRVDRTWTAAQPRDLDGSRGATAMTSVTRTDSGFLAGGYRDDPANAAASAAVWRSTDGLSWRRDASPDAFGGGRIWGVAARGATLVAVGTEGDPSYGPAAAWVSTGGPWRRADVADPGGVMRGVTATADGFIAVGFASDDSGARVWRSPDGITWTPVDDQLAFHNRSSPIWMFSVAADDRGLVVGGWQADAANGSAAAWASTDGEHWEQAPWVPDFSGGQMPGVALAGGIAVGAGRSGYPDNNQAAAWINGRP